MFYCIAIFFQTLSYRTKRDTAAGKNKRRRPKNAGKKKKNKVNVVIQACI